MGGIRVAEDLIEFEGLAPSGNAKRLFQISKAALLRHFEETGNTAMFEEAWLVPEVCDSPSGIWRGLKREGQEEAFCYAGKATGKYAARHGKAIATPAGKVFLVFATKDLSITKWRHCAEDPQCPGFPLGHGDRFGERLWP
jgi:hypothetical protein